MSIQTGQGSSSAASSAVTIVDGGSVTQGSIADAAVVGDNSGTLSAKIRGLNKVMADRAAAATPGAVRLSDGAAFYDSAKTGQLPSALVSSRLDVNIGAFPDGVNVTQGALADAAVVGDNSGSVSAKLRGINKVMADRAAAATPGASRLSDGSAFYDATKTGQLPTALVTGRLDVNIGASAVTIVAAGAKTNNAAVPGATNIGTLGAVATAAVPTYTEANQVALSTDLAGQLRVSSVGQVEGKVAAGASFTANPISISFVGTGATVRNATAANSLVSTTGNDILGVGGLYYDVGTGFWFRPLGDGSGRAIVTGGGVNQAAVVGNPHWIAGSTTAAGGNLQGLMVESAAQPNLRVTLHSGVNQATVVTSGDGVGGSIAGLQVVNRNAVYNGSTWDMQRAGSVATGAAVTGIAAGLAYSSNGTTLDPLKNDGGGANASLRVVLAAGGSTAQIGAPADGQAVVANLSVRATNLLYNGSTTDMWRGTATGGGFVQGGAAIGAALAGNPNVIAGLDTSNNVAIPAVRAALGDASSVTLSSMAVMANNYIYNGTTLDRWRGTATGGGFVQGPGADSAALAGNPVRIGASNGTNAYDLQVDNSTGKNLRVALYGATGTVANTFQNSQGDAQGNGAAGYVSVGYNYLFNGTTWDRVRGSSTGGFFMQGPVAEGGVFTGTNPVLIGGASTSTTVNAVSLTIQSSDAVAASSKNAMVTNGLKMSFGGTNIERDRNNVETAIQASTSTAAGTVNTDIITYNGKQLIVRAHVGSYGAAGSLLMKVQRKDVAGNFVDIPAATTGTLLVGADLMLVVGPNTWPANTTTEFYANQPMQRTLRIVTTVGVNNVTFSQDYAVSL